MASSTVTPVTLAALIVWVCWRAILSALGLALGVALLTGILVLASMRRLADLTGHRTTLVLPAAGDRFYWASLSTGFGMGSAGGAALRLTAGGRSQGRPYPRNRSRPGLAQPQKAP